MDDCVVLLEKTPSEESLCKSMFQGLKLEDVLVITISNTPARITFKDPVKVTDKPRVSPLIITTPGPIPYSYDKAIPWSYGADVYYHDVKQEPLAVVVPQNLPSHILQNLQRACFKISPRVAQFKGLLTVKN